MVVLKIHKVVGMGIGMLAIKSKTCGFSKW